MTAPAGTRSEAPEAASSLLPQPEAARTGTVRTATVASSLRIGPLSWVEGLEPDGVGTHAPRTVRLDQREAEREVLDRQTCRVEQRNPIRSGTARMGACQDGADLGHLLA